MTLVVTCTDANHEKGTIDLTYRNVSNREARLIQPVESRLVDVTGKPYPRKLTWTRGAWMSALRQAGQVADVERMERAQSKRERKNARRLNVATPDGAVVAGQGDVPVDASGAP